MELKQALDESEWAKEGARARARKCRTEANCRCQADGMKQALDESEKRALALERENAAQKQTADARQMELKQALDESEKRALALERENAAQKQTADARQMELKQALDKSGEDRRRSPVSLRPLARMMSRPAISLLRANAKMPHRSKLPMPGRWN